MIVEEEKSYVGMSTCFFCGKEKEVILDRFLRNSLPRKACYNHEPCGECAKYMKLGIIVISVLDGSSGDNPYRTGRWFVMKEEAINNMISEPILSEVLRKRVVFVEDSTLDKLGFPKKGE